MIQQLARASIPTEVPVINTTEVRAMLKLGHIPRWAIVETHKVQSVAEHCYNTAILSVSLYDHIFQTPHNSMDRDSILKWALVHDLDEVWTGDIPTPAKDILNSISPGITAELKSRVLMANSPESLAIIRGVKDSLAYAIVKLGETVESMLFVQSYAIREDVKTEVFEYLLGKLRDAYGHASLRQVGVDWARARDWINEFIPRAIL